MSLDVVPKMFNGITVGRSGLPLHALDSVIFQELVCNLGTMWSTIIVHEDEILANGSCVWNHTWLQYLIKVPLGYPPGMGTRSVYSLVLIPIPTSWHFYIGRVPHLVDSLRWVFLPTLLQTPTLLSGKTCTRQRRLKRTLLPNAVRSIGDVDL